MNTDDLRRAAEAATPGPWCFQRGDHWHSYVMVTAENDRTIHYKYGSGTRAANAQDERDAEFIAAANPARILALLAELDALRARVTYLEKTYGFNGREI